LNYTRRFHCICYFITVKKYMQAIFERKMPYKPKICTAFLFFSLFYYSQSLSKFAAISSAVSVNDITSKIVFP